MRINATDIHLQRHKTDCLTFITKSIDIINSKAIEAPSFYNENMHSDFCSMKEELKQAIKNEDFVLKKEIINKNIDCIFQEVKKLETNSFSKKIINEINTNLSLAEELTQCIFIQFEDYYTPSPYIIFNGKGEYSFFDGTKYEDFKNIGKNIRWYTSEVSFDFLLKYLWDLECLQDSNYEIEELFNVLQNYILSEIYLFFYKSLTSEFLINKLNKDKITFPFYVNIKEREIEPYTILILEK